ncbi:gliding motility-associated C-terminal domain-containing protein [Pedobacter rhodius]|uniref:Gliding motility-associated C-terminal domain-containing protein n=1 Tax=Pedobacter rhodius TaxID=3004098 RepID=A0ABT4KUB1_9SPHI|nr:gliding motility-associated C-terminal domain-containing protein [Pedobacter sp. SJ11]MCZ4222519.1 gliding motility-associated C-terminal domain-containing protein [Pedobacter sp. SJ11]
MLCNGLKLYALAAVPTNDDMANAIELKSLSAYCSASGAFNNMDATASGYKKGSFWNSEGKDIWFKFTAIATDISVNITGKSGTNANTLVNPLAAVYLLENKLLTELIGSMTSSNNLTTLYKGGLSIGQEYYIRISAENDATGSFQLCINNYNPPKKPGQDCSSASILCNKETFTELNISGAGSNNKESAGSCLSTESNSAWYTWTAANDGTLTFIITPTAITDDIDWVLYDLGVNGDCKNILSKNAIRCAAGSGVNCMPIYYQTGMDNTSTDLTEQSGCVTGQDGFVKFVDMVSDHVYALLVDNFSNGNNGFTISFSGTGEFKGPSSKISMQANAPCSKNQSFTFSSTGANYNALKWNFGTDANTAPASGQGPYEVTYNSPGKKTVVLEAIGARGCSTISSYSFNVSFQPDKPVITASKKSYCIGDQLVLSISEVENAIYSWIGPDNFKAETATISVPVTSSRQAGDYSVSIKLNGCESDQAIMTIPAIINKPIAGFTTDPLLPGKFAVPAPISFINQSQDATTYEWDFGDGTISAEANPTHLYTNAGVYTINLRAFSVNGCMSEANVNNLVMLQSSALLIPNSFSPNGDGINDEFNINITNLKKFQINIFNRYGDRIFSSNNLFDSWKGDRNGQSVPVGAYYYLINGIDLFNKEIKYSGSITLFR